MNIIGSKFSSVRLIRQNQLIIKYYPFYELFRFALLRSFTIKIVLDRASLVCHSLSFKFYIENYLTYLNSKVQYDFYELFYEPELHNCF